MIVFTTDTPSTGWGGLRIDTVNYDFSLLETSPCIDAGVAYLVAGGVTLVDLEPGQYQGAAPDIGAFEYDGEMLQIFADGFETGDTSTWSVAIP